MQNKTKKRWTYWWGYSPLSPWSHMKGAGMLVGNFEKPLKETNLDMGQPFFDP